MPTMVHKHTRSLCALVLSLAIFGTAGEARAADPAGTACPDANSGLSLPPGFCASIFADGHWSRAASHRRA